MSFEPTSSAFDLLVSGNYAAAAATYEKAIEDEPDVGSHYWYLGLCWLLQGQEFEAQAVWYSAGADQDDTEAWSDGLVSVLQWAAEHHAASEKFENAWLIRRYIYEFSSNTINADAINNALNLVLIAIKLGRDWVVELTESELINQLIVVAQSRTDSSTDSNWDNSQNLDFIIDEQLLFEALIQVLDQGVLQPIAYDFADVVCQILPPTTALLEALLRFCIRLAYDVRQPALAIQFAQLCLRLNIDNVEILRHLAAFYQNAQQYHEGIEAARQCYELSLTLPDKIFANHLLLRGLTTAGGFWDEAMKVSDRHHQLIQALMADYPTSLNAPRVLRLFTSLYELPYLNDAPQQFRNLQNQLAQLCQVNIERYSHDANDLSQSASPPRQQISVLKPLTIGYLSHCFGRHSVGWLARWLIQYHDRNRFHINGYFQGYRQGLDPLQEWYLGQFSQARIVSNQAAEIAHQIRVDDVDILVDLDSLTLDITCEVMSLKPAPVQATWLGWDASGVPAIDYFIADPYVLPDNAQDYYHEKIWRLSQTYIAVDGFEIGVPTLRREYLNIPSDAVIYFSSQRGFKRHPDTVRLQMQILKKVPNSYFLIKGKSDEMAVVQFFSEMAQSVGVEGDRVKFLPWATSEAEHRANMAIADVVLDTYPYNGATTTLETLWMGLPLVTLVGEQFAARNSYTMMMNAGVTEGIAWSPEEYISWGIRLGTDEVLRKEIHDKLRRSRQYSPLWNGKAFALEMERAYEEMWEKYCER